MTIITDDKMIDNKRQKTEEDELFVTIPAHLCDNLILEKNYVPRSPYNEDMIKSLREKGITDERILEIFRLIDRKLFLVSPLNVHLVREG